MATFAATLNTAPPLLRLSHLALVLGLGLFIGMERERRHKHAGLRTFAFVALIGGIGGVLGMPYAITSLALVGMLVCLINVESLIRQRDIELTTSAALLITCLAGILSGEGHTLTPTAVALVTAALLAWKEELVGFTVGLSDPEVRSAILLGILAFVVYPLLPAHAVGPGQVIEPRLAWITVLLIAGIGFGNYVLLKVYGSRGVELTGFFGGLVNSTVTVTELSERTRQTPSLAVSTYRAIMLSGAAMAIRNATLAAVIATATLRTAGVPLALMVVVAVGAAMLRPSRTSDEVPELRLHSPFSLRSALKFGLIFLAMQVVGDLAQESLGQVGFLAVCAVGGLVSSASAVASAAALAAHHSLPPAVAGIGMALASLSSLAVTLPIVRRVSGNALLSRRVTMGLAAIFLSGLVGVGVEWLAVGI